MKTEKDYLSLISREIKQAKKIFLAAHKGPDFDSAGSVFGLASALKKMGKRVSLEVYDLSAKMRQVFVAAGAFQKDSFSFKPDLAILLDYGAIRMLNQETLIKLKQTKIITIDHHRFADQNQLGGVVWVDERKTSASEMAFDLLRFMRFEFDEKTSFCLLLGMLSDSGSFVFQLASQKLLPKIQKMKLSGEKFSLAFRTVRSWDSLGDFVSFCRVGAKVKFDRELGLAYLVFSKNQGIPSLKSFLANELLLVDGVNCVLILKKDSQGGCRGSLRSSVFSSRGLDVSQIASSLGGGGHFYSAAFYSKLSSAKIIAKVKQLIREQKS